MDKSTVSRAITDVSRALTAKQPCFIKWPLTHDECEKIKNEFYIRGGFPGVVGRVDGTHMRLQAPTQDESNYVNRKVLISSMYKVFATMKVSRLFAIAKLPEENKNVNI